MTSKATSRILCGYQKSLKIDGSWVTRIREEFLILMKNLPRVKDYDTAIKLSQAFNYWSRHFDETFFKQFLNKSLKYDHDISDHARGYIDQKVRKSGWAFYIEAALPIERADKYWSPGARFDQYEKKVGTWEKGIRRKAQVFWKDLRNVIDYYENHVQKGQESPPSMQVNLPRIEKLVLEGFQVLIRDYKEGDDFDQDILEKIKSGLKIYRKNAAQRMPLLLKRQLPVTLSFQAEIGKGGTYDGNMIVVYAEALQSRGPFWMSHVMAHEMGHHVWQQYLSRKDQEFWEVAIKGNYGSLDIKEVLDKWPGDAWAFEFSKALGDTDPILALQMEAVSTKFDRLETKEQFQDLLDSGQRTVTVPKIPISGYANKSPQEAFCEAVGLLVTYGPGAVHEKIRGWLRTILPGQIKLSRRLNPCLFQSE